MGSPGCGRAPFRSPVGAVARGTGTVVAVLCLLLAAVPAIAAAPTAPAVVAVAPTAGEVVPAGQVEVAARLSGSPADVTVEIDGLLVDHDAELDDRGTALTATRNLAPGPHEVTVRAGADGEETVRTWPFTVSPVEVTRISGDDRIGTAVRIADAVADGEPLPAAVLVRADGFADALSAGVLAHVAGGVVLPTPGDALAPAVEEALARLVTADAVVYVLGGDQALTPPVAASVAALGRRVVRLGGDDRYATAARVAREVQRLSPAPDDAGTAAVVASGTSFADALAMSVPAARGGWPVLLTGREGLPHATRSALRDLDLDRVEVVGGPAAVSEEVADDVRRATGVEVRRTGGVDRYDTAAHVAARFLPNAGVSLADGLAAPDALTGSVLAAARAAPLLLTDQRLPAATAAALSSLDVDGLLVFGGPAAVSPRAVHDALRDRVDDRGLARDLTPGAGAWLPADAAPVIHVDAGAALDASSAGSLWIDGREAPVDARVDGDVLTLEVRSLPASLAEYASATARLRVGLRTTDGRVGHVDADYTVVHRPAVVATPEGWEGIGSKGPVAGSGGPMRRYSLEVEPATGVDLHAFAQQAEAILSDPRGWTADGGLRLQRVAPVDADIRVLLARPETVDSLCAQAGLDTGGFYSCWTGRVAALNLDRWNTGAPAFDAPLEVYRGYLVNHEVGHALDHGHRSCPHQGALAPVMMQQTKGTGACMPNAWPSP